MSGGGGGIKLHQHNLTQPALHEIKSFTPQNCCAYTISQCPAIRPEPNNGALQVLLLLVAYRYTTWLHYTKYARKPTGS